MKKNICGIIIFISLCLVFFSGCVNVSGNIIATNNTNDSVDYKLLFVQDGQIFLSDQQGLNAENISKNGKENFSPFWGDKGSTVLFIAKQDDYYEVRQNNISQNKSDLLWGSKKEPREVNISPDRRWLIYAEEKACFLFDIENKKAVRISDNCEAISWSASDKKILYLANNKLYWRDFNVSAELGQTNEASDREMKSPIFLDATTIIFEAKNLDSNPATYDLYQLSINNKQISRLTNLNFSQHADVSLQLSPDNSKMLYSFSAVSAPNTETWLVTLANPDLSKKVLDNAHKIIWNQQSDGYYFVQDDLDENNQIVHNIYQVSKDGLNKKKIIANADNPVYFYDVLSK